MNRNFNSVKTFFEIALPDFDAGEVKNFNFNTTIGELVFNFYFLYSELESKWLSWCIMPDGSKRLIGVVPKILNWSRFMDYSLYFEFDGTAILLNDLVTAKIILVVWKQ